MKNFLSYSLNKNSRLAKLYCSNIIDRLIWNSKEKIIIYQMGKVGSSTIYDSLRTLKSFDVYHVHTLTRNGIQKSDNIYRNNFHRSFIIPANQVQSEYLRRQLDKNLASKNKWKVVTLVRDPIAKNVSSFFQKLEHSLGYDYKNKTTFLKLEDITEELIKLFFEIFDGHDKPLTWFDGELKKVFGIDVFAEDFPKSKGYKIYQTSEIELLVLRLENLNECASEAFKSFLGINEFKLIKTNIGRNKTYADIYHQFLDSIVLPDFYLEKMYTSKYACHFYSEEEITAFKAKWLRKNHTYC